MLGHVALVDLQHVVIDVEYGERHRDPVDPERLELHGAHGAGGVLDEDLVDVDDKIGAGFERASPAMCGEEDAREVLGHLPGIPSRTCDHTGSPFRTASAHRPTFGLQTSSAWPPGPGVSADAVETSVIPLCANNFAENEAIADRIRLLFFSVVCKRSELEPEGGGLLQAPRKSVRARRAPASSVPRHREMHSPSAPATATPPTDRCATSQEEPPGVRPEPAAILPSPPPPHRPRRAA